MLSCTQCGSSVALPADPSALTTACGRCGSSLDLGSMRTIADVVATPPPADDGLLPGRTISGYRIEQLLGRGGMASVYKATQLSLNRPVAIKVLPRSLAQNPAFVARFTREAGALAALNHPNIINIIDRGVDGETYYFVMEFVDGTDLQAAGRPSPPEACRIVGQVCAALDYAHKRGVIHRDIKPGNIMIDRNGTVKVTDFGIAHLAGTQETSFGLTVAGAAMGTVNYMAPEQRTDARTVDGRADLYALGVVLYELLTGQLPIGAFDPPSRLNPAVDARMDALVTRALKQDPAARFASAQEFAAALAPLAGSVPSVEPAPIEPPPAPTNLPCPHCKSENRADAKFCLNCGKTLIETCPKCRKNVRSGAKFCDSCGTNIGEYVTQVRESLKTRLTTAAGLEKERRYAEALTELDAILGAEGTDLDELKRQAAEYKRRVAEAKEKLDAEFRIGQDHYDRREFERAVERWMRLPIGLAYVKDAIAEAKRKIEARDASIRAADAAFAGARFEEALEQWRRAAELVPPPPPFAAKMEQARAKVAEAKYVEANRRGTQALAARKYAEAVAAWTEALQWKPDDAVAKSELQKAELLKRAADRDALIAKGEQAMATGRARDALAAWKQALALLVPDNPQLRADLNARIRAAQARADQDMKKLLMIGGAAAGGLLFVVLLIVAIVLIAGKKDDPKPSPGPSGPGRSESTPEEIVDRFLELARAGSYEATYDLYSRRYRAAVSLDQHVQWAETAFAGVDASQIRRQRTDRRDSVAFVHCVYQRQPFAYRLVKDPEGWRIEPQ